MLEVNTNTNGDRKEASWMNRRFFTKAAFSVAGACAVVGFNAFKPSTAYGEPTSAEKQAEADEVKKQLDAWAAELDKASADYFTALEAHDAAIAKMGEAEASIQAAEDEVKRLQDRLGARATSMYKNGEVSFLQVLFGASSFTEFTTGWGLLSSISNDDAHLISDSKTAKQLAEDAHTEYATQEKIAQEKQEEAEEIKVKAEETVAATQAQLASLEAEIAELIQKEREEEERRQREAAAAALAAAAAAANNNNGGGGGGGGAKAPSYSAVTGNAVVDRALGCLGLPYVWGGVGPSGFDCSGLVSYALSGSYRRLGTTYTFLGWPRVSDPQPGDVCTNSGHCGIYYGNGQMIHAATYGVGVIIGPVQSGMVFVRY